MISTQQKFIGNNLIAFTQKVLSTDKAFTEFYGDIYTSNKAILTQNGYDIIRFLQENFNHVKDNLDFTKKDEVKAKVRLLIEENEEMTEQGLNNKNLKLFRDAVADQVTIAHFLALVVKGLDSIDNTLHETIKLPIPQSYTEYAQAVNKAVTAVSESFQGDDIAVAQEKLNLLLITLYTLPEFSNFSLSLDLIDVTVASLTKICTSQEVADATLESYKQQGYDCHIAPVDLGLAIFVSNDCTVDGKVIPKGKFLKSIKKKDPLLLPVIENSVW